MLLVLEVAVAVAVAVASPLPISCPYNHFTHLFSLGFASPENKNL
jgi:hypothetical protein